MEGTSGRISTDAALAIQDDHVVFVIDFELADVPSWIEWSPDDNTFFITQMGGATAELQAHDIPDSVVEKLGQINRILFIARSGQKKVAHFLTFLVTQS